LKTTILITGANGFIGQYLLNNFKYDNYNILFATTSDNNNTKYYTFSSLFSDINEVLLNIRVDIIIHLAAIIPNSFEEADFDLFMKNIKMMDNLSKFAINRKITKFIYLSSFGSMINPPTYDIKDYYTLSKITGEHICAIMENSGIETASLRISSPFGEFYSKNNVLSRFIDLALTNKDIHVYGTGMRMQNFVYVGNISECIKKCIDCKIRGVYDIVNSSNINMLSLAKLIVKLTKSKSKIIVGINNDPLEHNKICKFSLERTFKELNCEEILSFEESIVKYIEWRREKR
jgi:UDP-glucose 4-epimerase